ncbi:conserved hypothetical protein [Actinacidiphila bryophytorum]|uniref:DUF3499 domain-containing protein n=1 Tax=Actinacidiphila bryophytorum TaxID=1436133 RepID=A0A9W4H084_9ACTN|nr:conserved hypothetical protein [Actinacidiphila bryophytorum]
MTARPALVRTSRHCGITAGPRDGGTSAPADRAATTRPGEPAESRRGPLKSAVPSNLVSPVRRCSRTACGRPAVATLTYVYADSTAVLGPLATYAEPHCYDLCSEHSERLTAPRGWEVVRLAVDTGPVRPSGDDLEALANAVREAARPQERPRAGARDIDPLEVARRGHLRVLRSPE